MVLDKDRLEKAYPMNSERISYLYSDDTKNGSGKDYWLFPMDDRLPSKVTGLGAIHDSSQQELKKESGVRPICWVNIE